jgi:carboxyl-terminal processing protease
LSDRVNWKRAFKQAVAVGLILCLGIILLFSGFAFANYDNLGRLVKIIYLIDSQYLDQPPLTKLVDGAIDGMVSSLDPYSTFQDEAENDELMNSFKGSFGGIGVHLSTDRPEPIGNNASDQRLSG